MKQIAKRLVLPLFVAWILVGCGRVITPTAEAGLQAAATPAVQTVTATFTPRATSTPRVATPIATPTPTITPTPIIYTIQPGDTLLKIALQFDRTNEAIQEANGITDPRYLQIGQKLIIPPPKTGPDDPPTPTPTPLPLTVTAINFQETEDGPLWCLGAVHNPGDVPLTEIVIEASLLDESGGLLAREAAFTQLDVALPDQSVPFSLLFDSPPSSFAQYQVMPVSGVPVPEETRYYFDLETFDLRGKPKGPNAYTVSGQLRNFGTEDIETVRLAVIAYDDEERALAQRQAELAVSLLKGGATTPFEIDLIVPNGEVARFEALAEGLRVE